MYGVVVTVVASISSVVLSVVLSLNMAKNAIESEQRAREETRVATCLVVGAQVAVYDEVPPSTPTGKKAELAWRDLYASPRLHCERP